MNARPPAVAGKFYPQDPMELRQMVDGFLAQVNVDGPVPEALILPHAGYIYSAPIAATGYARLTPAGGRIRRVVLLGPAHRVNFHGLAAPSNDYFSTPLGDVPLDRDLIAELVTSPHVHILDAAHVAEHSLEVHLPFLQIVLDDFLLVPLLVSQTDSGAVADVLDAVWQNESTVVIVSSDLSHHLDYDTAAQRDRQTANAIENMEPDRIGQRDACGYRAIHGLIQVAKKRHLHIKAVDLRNSGDTAGPRNQVVGYGAYAVGSVT